MTLNAQVIFNVKTPAPLAGNYAMTIPAAGSGWGFPDMNIAANAVEETLVFVANDSLACTAPTNGAALAGKIAVLYRGTCEFGAKAKNAQDAGAIGVIIINNQGAPIAMGAGAQGVNVTVPTIMISTEDGAKLRSEVKAGNVRGFIGTKSGLYPNDLGYKVEQVVYAPQAARPISISNTAGDYSIEPGLWVYNFGNQAQSGASASCVITKGGTSVYTETQSGISLASGDSTFVTFPAYAPAFTAAAEYTMTYTVTGANTDEYPDDNSKQATFSVTEGTYSYARVDAGGLPVANNFVKSTNAAPVFYCMVFREPKATQLSTLKGFSFATTPQTPYRLLNEYVEIEMYELNDPFTDLNDDPTFDDLTSIAFTEYTYSSSDLANKTVYVPYNDGNVQLVPDQRYLTCVRILTDSVFFGFNSELDYNANLDKYLQPISPIKSGGTWFAGGFGSNTSSAIGVHFTTPTGSGIEDKMVLATEAAAFPTPSNQYVNIPFSAADAKSATIQVMDLNGKLVTTTTATVNGANLRVNTTNLSNGSYLFNVTLDNGKSSAFRVMVAR